LIERLVKYKKENFKKQNISEFFRKICTSPLTNITKYMLPKRETRSSVRDDTLFNLLGEEATIGCATGNDHSGGTTPWFGLDV